MRIDPVGLLLRRRDPQPGRARDLRLAQPGVVGRSRWSWHPAWWSGCWSAAPSATASTATRSGPESSWSAPPPPSPSWSARSPDPRGRGRRTRETRNGSARAAADGRSVPRFLRPPDPSELPPRGVGVDEDVARRRTRWPANASYRLTDLAERTGSRARLRPTCGPAAYDVAASARRPRPRWWRSSCSWSARVAWPGATTVLCSPPRRAVTQRSPHRFYAPSPWLRTFSCPPGSAPRHPSRGAEVTSAHTSGRRGDHGAAVTSTASSISPSSAIAQSGPSARARRLPGREPGGVLGYGDHVGPAQHRDEPLGVTVTGLGTYDTVNGADRRAADSERARASAQPADVDGRLDVGVRLQPHPQRWQ